MSSANSGDFLRAGFLNGQEIRAAVQRGEIRILVPNPNELGTDHKKEEKFPFDDLEHYVPAVRSNAFNDYPGKCMESTGYQLLPFRYYDRSDGKWKLIPSGETGLILKPRQEVAIEPLQYVGLNDQYCALHFARFSGQLSGIIVATGLIQPGWGRPDPGTEVGAAPVFTYVRNVGSTAIHITRHNALTRLVFCRVSRTGSLGPGTSLKAIRDKIETDEAKLRARNTRQAWLRGFRFFITFVILFSALFWLPLVLPWTGAETGINQYIGDAIVALLAFLVAQFVNGIRK